MDTIGHVLRDKGAKVHTATLDETALHAVEHMCQERIGAVLICEGGRPIGIFTERDLMTKVILARRDPVTTKLDEVMSRDIVYVEPSTSTGEAMAVMTERRCRHLPVLDGGAIVGVVSIGDLVRWASRNQEYEIRQLTDYICGKYPG